METNKMTSKHQEFLEHIKLKGLGTKSMIILVMYFLTISFFALSMGNSAISVTSETTTTVLVLIFVGWACIVNAIRVTYGMIVLENFYNNPYITRYISTCAPLHSTHKAILSLNSLSTIILCSVMGVLGGYWWVGVAFLSLSKLAEILTRWCSEKVFRDAFLKEPEENIEVLLEMVKEHQEMVKQYQ